MNLFDTGYWTALRWRGVPIRLHWTIPVGVLLFSGGRFSPGVWIGIFLLILVHEMGHAFLVFAQGHRTYSIDVHGFGGLCRYGGHVTPRSRAIIAWGGVLGQSLLLLVGLALTAVGATGFAGQLAHAFVRVNLWLMLLNLLPFPVLDGGEAWRLFQMPGRPWEGWFPVWKQRRERKRREREAAKRRAAQKDAEHKAGELVSDLLEEAKRRNRLN
jgi:Zn-dependent protease